MNGPAPTIELLWWEGCPSWPEALEMLREAAAEHGLDPEGIEMIHVTTDAEAERRTTGENDDRSDRDHRPEGWRAGALLRAARHRGGHPLAARRCAGHGGGLHLQPLPLRAGLARPARGGRPRLRRPRRALLRDQ